LIIQRQSVIPLGNDLVRPVQPDGSNLETRQFDAPAARRDSLPIRVNWRRSVTRRRSLPLLLANAFYFSAIQSGKIRRELGIVDPHLHRVGLLLSTECNEKSMLQRPCQSPCPHPDMEKA
jgi:hypothetical protein